MLFRSIPGCSPICYPLYIKLTPKSYLVVISRWALITDFLEGEQLNSKMQSNSYHAGPTTRAPPAPMYSQIPPTHPQNHLQQYLHPIEIIQGFNKLSNRLKMVEMQQANDVMIPEYGLSFLAISRGAQTIAAAYL